MQRLNDEREGAGPGEAEGEADGIAEGGVGAARAVGDAEGVGAEDGGDGAAVGAGRLGGHAGLVVLEADAEEGLAVALLEPAGAGAAPAAAVAVAEQPLLIDKLLQLQLEDPGGADLAAAQQHREDGERQQEPTSHFGGAALVPSLSSPLSSRQREKGKVSLGVREKTQRPKPLVPAELEKLVSRSPSFRSVSDFFFSFVDTSRCSLSATGSSFGWQKKKREEKDGRKKMQIFIC